MSEQLMSYMSLSSMVPEDSWPAELFSMLSTDDGLSLLDYFAYIDSGVSVDEKGFSMRLKTRVMKNVDIPLPFLDGCALVIGQSSDDDSGLIEVDFYYGSGTETPIEEESGEEPPEEEPAEEEPVVMLRIRAELFSFRFSRDWLTPVNVTREEDGGVIGFEEIDGHVDISLGRITLVVGYRDGDWFIDFDWDMSDDGEDGEEGGGISIPACEIGNTGVIFEASNMAFNFSGHGVRPDDAPGDWKGFFIESADIYIPEVFQGSIGVENFGIGTGGIYGRIEAEFDADYHPDGDERGRKITGDLAARFLGMEGAITGIGIEFTRTIPVEFDIRGKLLFPFFDEPVDISIGIGTDGDFFLTLADTDEDGIYTFRREGLLEARLESIGIEKQDDLFIFSIGGSITPLLGDGIDWPTIAIEKLSIDTEGNVQLDGGWVDIPDRLSFDLRGFRVDISQIGFGTEELESGGEIKKYNWIGFSGGIQLVQGLEAGASVEGLKIKWCGTDFKFELAGVGVNLEIPNVLRLDGHVTFFDGDTSGFKGDISLDLMAVGLEMNASMVVGKRTRPDFSTYKFFYLYLDIELPAGIPLGASGAGLFGLAGLFAYNMEPDKRETEEWYENDDGSPGWYKRGDREGVSDVDKWTDVEGSMAIGGGITLGTVADNGYLISAKALLVIVLPGPIIMIEGKANFLKRRSELSEDPIFRALAVLDNRAGYFLLNIEAAYKYDADEGRVLDIHGGCEVFFDYHKANNWHLYLGEKEPRDKRIRASIISIFKAEIYFMLEPTRLAWGFWLGFDERWEWGPVRLTAAAWAEGGMDASWKPQHFWGKFWLHGELTLKIFCFEFGLYLDAGIEGNTPTPYYVLLALKIGIILPGPLPDFEIGIDLKWTRPKEPPWPMPLKEVGVGHELVQDNIPLPRGSLLLPCLDSPGDPENADEFIDDAGAIPDRPQDSWPEADIPVVPMDARPMLTFNKPAWDVAEVGENPRDLVPEFLEIGHEGDDEDLVNWSYQFQLIDLLLEKKTGPGTWYTYAHKGIRDASWDPDSTPPEIKGMWQAAMDGEGNPTQTKLMLWTRSAFSFARYSTRDYVDEFMEENPDYPCIPVVEPEMVCVDFNGAALGTNLDRLECEGVDFRTANTFSIVEIADCCPTGAVPGSGLLGGIGRSLRVLEKHPASLFISLPEPVSWFRLLVCFMVDARIDVLGPMGEALPGPPDVVPGAVREMVFGDDTCGEDHKISHIAIHGMAGTNRLEFCLYGICYLTASQCDEVQANREHRARLTDMLARWNAEDDILSPYTTYRMQITTRMVRKKDEVDDQTKDVNETVYFRTEGPPGFMELPEAVTGEEGEAVSHGHRLNTLEAYVEKTWPEPGQTPVYRAYDVAIGFNKPYVELMYSAAGHDLGIYLSDNNERPALDADGRVISFANGWSKGSDIDLSETDREILESAPCVDIDLDAAPRNDVLENGAADRFLRPQTLYNARLIAMLLHDDFDRFGLEFDRDNIVLDGNKSRPASRNNWEIDKTGVVACLKQTSNIFSVAGTEPDLPACRGTYYRMGMDWWTDYRVTVVMASYAAGAVGFMFRVADKDNYYRFSMDRENNYRRLIKMSGGRAEILHTETAAFEEGQKYTVTVEAIKESIRVYFNGHPWYSGEDKDRCIFAGYVAPYSWRNTGARFYRVMVEDLRIDAPVLYSFPFTTSRYANFFHHVHSFDDRVWERLPVPAGASWIGDDFQTAWGDFFKLPAKLEITPITQSGKISGFLLASPEPIDWKRLNLTIKRSVMEFPRNPLPPPGKLKITKTSEKSVQILIREDFCLSGCRIEFKPKANDRSWQLFKKITTPPAKKSPAGQTLTFRITHTPFTLPEKPDPTETTTPSFTITPEPIGTIDKFPPIFRIVDPDRTEIHRKALLPKTFYEPAFTPQILPSPDGTAALIRPPSLHTAIQPNRLYRFKLTYAKTGTELEPLKQWGSSANEVAELEFYVG